MALLSILQKGQDPTRSLSAIFALAQEFYSASAIVQVCFHCIILIILFACGIIVLRRRSALYNSFCSLIFSRDIAIYIITILCSAGMLHGYIMIVLNETFFLLVALSSELSETIQAAIELIKYTSGSITSPFVNAVHAILIVATIVITSLSIFMTDIVVPCIACYLMVLLTQDLVSRKLLTFTKIALLAIIPIASFLVNAITIAIFATFEASSVHSNFELHASLAWIVAHLLFLALMVYFGACANARRKLMNEQDITVETLFSLVCANCIGILLILQSFAVFASFLIHFTISLAMMVLHFMRVITSFQFVQRVSQSLLIPVYGIVVICTIGNIVKERRSGVGSSSMANSNKESEAMLNDY